MTKLQNSDLTEAYRLQAEAVQALAAQYRAATATRSPESAAACAHDWMEFGGPGDEWRECLLCGEVQDQ